MRNHMSRAGDPLPGGGTRGHGLAMGLTVGTTMAGGSIEVAGFVPAAVSFLRHPRFICPLWKFAEYSRNSLCEYTISKRGLLRDELILSSRFSQNDCHSGGVLKM
mgnify:CR=1 FL=1